VDQQREVHGVCVGTDDTPTYLRRAERYMGAVISSARQYNTMHQKVS